MRRCRGSFSLMRHYLKGSPVPRTLHPWPGRQEGKDEGRRAAQGLPRLYLLSSKKIHFFLFLFFLPGGLSRLYRMCRVSRQLGVSLPHVIKRANKKERDLVWAKPERKRCKITLLSAVPTRSLPATLGYLSCVVSSIALRYRPPFDLISPQFGPK